MVQKFTHSLSDTHRVALAREHERLDVVLPAVDVDDHERLGHLAQPRVRLHAAQRVQTHEVQRQAVVRDAATQALKCRWLVNQSR